MVTDRGCCVARGSGMMRNLIHSLAEAIRRHAVLAYFGLVLLISWGSGALLEGPIFLRGKTIPSMLVETTLFSTTVVSVACVGLALAGEVPGGAAWAMRSRASADGGLGRA